MKLQTLKKKKKAFTLLELLVVLAILAILIAIAIPVYKGQKEKAAITAHNANVRVLETAVSMSTLTTKKCQCPLRPRKRQK